VRRAVLASVVVFLAGAGMAGTFLQHPLFGTMLKLKDDRALSPKDDRFVRFCEGVRLRQEGKPEEALAVLEKALALDPDSAAIHFEIGSCYYAMGKNAEAIKHLRRATELDPDFGPAHQALAFAHFNRGENAEGLAALERAARAAYRPRNHEALVRRLAWVYERRGDRKRAIEWYKFMLDCGYRDRRSYLSLGALELKEHLYDHALRSFRAVVRRTPADRALAPDIASAYAQLSEAERNEAIRHHEKVAAGSADPAIHEVLALAYRAAGRRDDMLKAFERAAGYASRRAATQKAFLAEYYEQLGELPKAIAWRKELIKSRTKPSAEDYVRLAGLYVKHEEMVEAADAYRKAIEAEPSRSDLLIRVAECHSQLYQWDRAAKAIEQYLKGRKLKPSDAEHIFSLAEVYRQAGKTALARERKKQAYKLLEDAIRRPGEEMRRVEYYLLLAQFHYADDRPGKALDYILVARNLDPDDDRKLLLLASAYKRVQRWSDAAETLRRLVEKNPESRAAAGALDEIATCLETDGKTAEAEATRKKAKDLLTKLAEKAEKNSEKASIFAQIGEMALARNNPKEASEAFLKALSRQPENPLFHLYLGQCYEYLADWPRAAAHYNTYVESVELDERSARALFRLGVTQSRAGQKELGAKNKKKAIEFLAATLQTLEREGRGTMTHKADLLRTLASFYAGEKDYKKAVETIKRAIAIAPSGQRTEMRLALAAYYDDMGLYDQSEAVLLQAHKEAPNDPTVLNHLGYFYAERGKNLDQAVELVKKALRYEPLNGAYIDSLGWAYYKQGKHDEALKLLLRAVKYEEDAVIRDHLGDAYMKLGQVEKARQAWQRALALDPGIKGVREKLEAAKTPKDKR